MSVTTSPAPSGSGPLTRPLLGKVPAITALFWIVKLLSTAGGEAGADWLDREALGTRYALLLTTALLTGALIWQLSLRRHVVVAYWTVVGLVGVAGTLITDAIVEGIGAVTGHAELITTAGFLVALLAVFATWYLVEGTLSIHSITTRRRELFYWAVVLLTFALGTAVGDLTAFTLGWGLLPSAALFAAVFAAAGIAHLRFGLPAVACFWTAYVITRPLGATVADWFAFAPDQLGPGRGGIGLGFLPVAVVLGVVMAGLVGYLAVTRRDVPADTSPEASA